jgi:TRAP-type C4-dicarboxylate transport system permease small subunit
MRQVIKWGSRIADGIAATMLAAIFLTFLLQIATRYAPRIVSDLGLAEWWPWLGTIAPLGWTLELIGILWVWVIFFSCAFVVREYDHVRFDILYLSVPRKVRAVFAIVGAIVVAGVMFYSFLPTWDYIDWMKMRRTSTVRNPFSGEKIPLRTIFSVYAVFMLAVAARSLWLIVDVIRNGPTKTELEVALQAQTADTAAEDTR